MTDEKAKEVLQEQIDKYGQEYDAEGIEALEIAIKRLEQTELNPSYNSVKTELKPSEDCISILNRIMEYTYGMMTTEKFGLQHLIKSMMDDLPSVTPQQARWIPVSERLPKENEYIGNVCKYYLVQDEYGDMHVAHLSNVGWIPMDSLKAIGDEVIAWMPLPQPYKAESEDEE